jgi:hypothetical protein
MYKCQSIALLGAWVLQNERVSLHRSLSLTRGGRHSIYNFVHSVIVVIFTEHCRSPVANLLFSVAQQFLDTGGEDHDD